MRPLLTSLACLTLILSMTSCVSESDVRAQVDKAKADMQSEWNARADRLSAEVASVRVETLTRTDKLAAEVSGLRIELNRVTIGLTKSLHDLERVIEGSTGMLREHLQQQRLALAAQIKSLDQILASEQYGTGAAIGDTTSSATSMAVPTRRP
ncbi:MAG: hypothetical protein AAB263_09780 [Planctomycetota bacterium]